MRIDSKPSIARVSKATKSRGSKGSGDFQTRISATDSVVAGIGSIAGSDAIRGIDALLAVQQVEASPIQVERDWARHWGGDILSRLSQLRDGLLSGNLPLERLEHLSAALDTRQDVHDPELRQVVDEIELRARIEIAKLQRDSAHRQK